ncbi:hypothetical protein [Cryobacterium sp. W22_MBD10_FK3]|uniref:hypothetical protein n=1 Tax=Cryobacterium sp. W22_MBD10_FK3 TaxID=3240273 RepID=UPI003F8FC1EB
MSHQQRRRIRTDAVLVGTATLLLSCLLLYALVRQGFVIMLASVMIAVIVLGVTFALLIRNQKRRPWAYALRALVAGVVAMFAFAVCTTATLEITAAAAGYGTFGWFYGLAATFVGGCLVGVPLIPGLLGLAVGGLLRPTSAEHQD